MPKDDNVGCVGKHLRYKVIFSMKLPLSLKNRKQFNACISRLLVLQRCAHGLDLSNLKIKSEDFTGCGLVVETNTGSKDTRRLGVLKRISTRRLNIEKVIRDGGC